MFITAGGALCLPLGAGMQNVKQAQSPCRGTQGQEEKLRAWAGEGKFLLGTREKIFTMRVVKKSTGTRLGQELPSLEIS